MINSVFHANDHAKIQRHALRIAFLPISFRQFKCRFCQKGFHLKGNRENHEMTHTGSVCISRIKKCYFVDHSRYDNQIVRQNGILFTVS